MYEVNRSIALIRPRTPFFDWLQALPGNIAEGLTLDDLRSDSNALLIPPNDDAEDALAFIMERAESLFAAELSDWCEDDALWPGTLDADTFAVWFDVEIHTILTDLVDAPLEREQFEPFDLPQAD